MRPKPKHYKLSLTVDQMIALKLIIHDMPAMNSSTTLGRFLTLEERQARAAVMQIVRNVGKH